MSAIQSQPEVLQVSTDKALVLRASILPDVLKASRLSAPQRYQAKQMAMTIKLDDSKALLDFGSEETLTPIANKMVEMVRVKDLENTEVMKTLSAFEKITTDLDPTPLIHPNGFAKAFLLGKMISDYIKRWDTLKKRLDMIEQTLRRQGDLEGRIITQLEGLYLETGNLYDRDLLLEAACRFLLDRMKNEFSTRKARIDPDDIKAVADLSEFADNIGIIDGRSFSLYAARVDAVSIGKQVKLLQTTNRKLYATIRDKLLTSLPGFKIRMAAFVSLLQTRGVLEQLERYDAAEKKSRDAFREALHDTSVQVAGLGQQRVTEIDAIVADFESFKTTMAEIGQINAQLQTARAEGEKKLEGLLTDMNKVALANDPTAPVVVPQGSADLER